MRISGDLGHAVRHLRQSPGYALTVVVTFALAMGANSAIFTAVRTVLLRPLPVDAPGDLAVVWQTDEGGQAVVELTYRHLREWTSAGNLFVRASVMGSHNWNAVLQGRGDPSRIWFSGVSAGFFETLGAKPLIGRTLRDSDDVPNAPPVAVLNYNTWLRRFGGDSDVIGQRMVLDGESVEIVGVMAPGVDVPRGAEFWMPVVPVIASGTPPNMAALDTLGVFYVVGRVRPGLDVRNVVAEVDAVEARLDRADAGRLKWGTRAVVTPFLDYVFGPVRSALRVLWAAVTVLLLIACANVSGLMLTRVSERRREHGIRLALGATPGSITRLWIIETSIVSVAGGAFGLLIAEWIAGAIVALAPDDLPRLGEMSIDPPVALFTFAVVLAVALLTAAVPIRSARTANLVEALQGGRTTPSRRTLRTRSSLLIVQIALSFVLLVAAGLVVRSFIALRNVALGFAPDRVLSLTVQPADTGRPPNVWMHDLLTRVRAAPGIEAAGAVVLRPLMLGPIGQGVRVVLEGQPQTRETEDANPTLNHQIASTGYCETLRILLKAGRFFTEHDTTDSPRVAIVSESTARRLWPGQDPIGKRISMASFTPGVRGRVWRTIVGVVGDVRYRGLDEVQLDVYDAALQTGRPADNVLVRTSGDPLAAAGLVRTIARELDSRSIVDDITVMDAVVARAEAPWRLTMWMFVLFAALAFGLAALGLFSLVALDVTERRRELAVRQALGASRRAILRGVFARAGSWVITGVSLGMAGSLGASRAVGTLLFGVAPLDPITYAGVVVLVLIVVVAASYAPARRAAAAEPQVLLRAE